MTSILNTIVPIFGVILLGYVATARGWFATEAIRGFSLFLFYFAVPSNLFRSTALAALPPHLPWDLFLTYFLGMFAVFAVGMGVGWLVGKHPLGEQGICGLSAAYSNLVFIGVPVVLSAFGNDAALPLFLLIAVHSPVLFPTTTVVLALGNTHHLSWRSVLRQIGQDVVTNPLVVSLLLGMGWNLSGWPLPSVLDTWAQILGAAAAPCGLFITGAALSQYRLAGQWREPVTLASLKLCLQPVLVWVLAALVFRLPPLWSQVATVLAALPTAANAYLFAQRYHVGTGTAAAVSVVSTAASCVTLTVVLLLVR